MTAHPTLKEEDIRHMVEYVLSLDSKTEGQSKGGKESVSSSPSLANAKESLKGINDNDYFSATDYYYTQGYNFELTSPWLRKNPLNPLFKKLKKSDQKYGLSIEHMGYTPTSISSDAILYGNRPFAAAIMLKSFLVSTLLCQTKK